MKFYCVQSRYSLPTNIDYPCFTLEKDNWDDFGYKTLFSLRFHKKKGSTLLIGDVKILNINDEVITTIPSEFNGLDESFCSLGQTTAYYQYFRKLDTRDARSILWALKDITLNSNRYRRFKNLRGFDISLIRFSEALSAFNLGVSLSNPDHPNTLQGVHRKPEFYEPISFVFQTLLDNADAEHRVEFSFDDNPWLPKRINVIIGNNGTGKTAFLIKFANCLSGWKPLDGEFPLFERPPFTKVFAVSYSPFENFSKPGSKDFDKRTFSYKYCGIRDDDDHINFSNLLEKSQKNLLEILDDDERRELFLEFIRLLSINVNVFTKGVKDFFYQLSSGQRILLFILSDIVANVTHDSLIIFDEPENHLHPNLLAQLMFALRKILHSFDSYAIIATHSPIVLQDVPSDCVRIIRRVHNTPVIANLSIESFAENLTTLTEEVFETSVSNSIWTSVLQNMSKNLGYEEALSMFPNSLSLNGKIYLKSLYLEEYKQ